MSVWRRAWGGRAGGNGAPLPLLPAVPLQLTLGALGLCMLPYFPHQPLWLDVLLTALFCGRGLMAARAWPSPPAWGLLLVAVLAGRVLMGSYDTLAGRDGGTAVLLLLAALKTLETRRRRDALVLVLLGYFVTAAQFFFDQTPGVALVTLLCALALTACLVVWSRPDAGAALRPSLALRRAGTLLLQAAPLTAVLFVLFPRPDGPLWQMPVRSSTQSQSGLSDSVTPGAISSLAQDDSVAFRASFQGPLPPPEERYWRGPVLEQFDGRRWSAAPMNRADPLAYMHPQAEAKDVLRYRVTLEPSSQPWGLALDAPVNVPNDLLVTRNLQLIVPGGVNTRRQFDLQALTHYRYGEHEPPALLQADVGVPAGHNPRARALAEGWAALPPLARVRAALRFFQQDGLRYTLTPPLLTSADPVDELLYTSKLGFCEHFASSFAYLMRAAGIPARLVTGYLGGQVNTQAGGAGYLIVRQADAHAWVEVWLPGQGWTRVDPTAAVAPARLQGGLAAALPGAVSALDSGRGVLPLLSLRLDALQHAWNQWVIGYDFARQQGLLRRLGLGDVGGVRYAVALAALLALGILPAWWVRRARRDPLTAAYARLGRRLRLPQRPTETPAEYARRAEQAFPERAAGIRAVTQEYLEWRYGPPRPRTPADLRAFRGRIGRV